MLNKEPKATQLAMVDSDPDGLVPELMLLKVCHIAAQGQWRNWLTVVSPVVRGTHFSLYLPLYYLNGFFTSIVLKNKKYLKINVQNWTNYTPHSSSAGDMLNNLLKWEICQTHWTSFFSLPLTSVKSGTKMYWCYFLNNSHICLSALSLNQRSLGL